MELLQPSWLWHAVRTVKWSVTAGSHFDLLTFALWEKCMKEEHVTGLRSTNAERHAWWSTLVNFARSLSLDPMETDRLVLPDGDLLALRRMVLNPCAYVPQQPRGDASERTNADLHLLSFHLVAKEVRMILGNKSKKNARKEIEKWFANNTWPKTVFPPDHDERVRAACEAANNITALMSARKITVDKDKEELASHLWSD
ncbi:hypothetical protein CALVIDRAFT_543349 [Calocera viscosa TUFC12733]|uniref:Uncharacterized protein n=1 Tax=Calocera viscosa (strain TUFC12733) TaxID=1330018 RepID=A0A167FPP4_CALVF|nr:hypothetical protein CALVIDRAFT_543349 [Calocera viscosa TUFC12733]